MLLSSGDGCFQSTIALQKLSRHCIESCQSCMYAVDSVDAAHLRDPNRIRLDERAEAAERRVLLLALGDLAQRLAPRLCKVVQQ